MAIKIGIQLYSVRNSFAADDLATLTAVSATGYHYVEAANHNAQEDDGVGFGIPAGELRDKLSSLGLKIVGCHINPLLLDRMPAVLDYHQELGNRQIGCDTEFFPYNDLDYIYRRCEFFNKIGEGTPFSQAVRQACEEGYSEPDPRVDLSGRDVIRKLVILAREAGYRLEQSDVEVRPFLPQDYFDGPLPDFWDRLPLQDAHFEQYRQALEARHCRWRFVARLEQGHATVGLEEVDGTHPFYPLEGSNNIILLTTERYREYPMMIQGYGAGASVTAAGVFADIMSIANV